MIEDNVTIFPNSFISNSIVGKGTKIYTSVIDKSKIGSCCSIGPFSHLKKASLVGHVKVGAFSEIKNTELEYGCVLSAGTIYLDNKQV